MIESVRGILKGSLQVFGIQIGHFFKNLLRV
jgi:hypothetical protein